jgi:hypothetical protein
MVAPTCFGVIANFMELKPKSLKHSVINSFTVDIQVNGAGFVQYVQK